MSKNTLITASGSEDNSMQRVVSGDYVLALERHEPQEATKSDGSRGSARRSLSVGLWRVTWKQDGEDRSCSCDYRETACMMVRSMLADLRVTELHLFQAKTVPPDSQPATSAGARYQVAGAWRVVWMRDNKTEGAVTCEDATSAYEELLEAIGRGETGDFVITRENVAISDSLAGKGN